MAKHPKCVFSFCPECGKSGLDYVENEYFNCKNCGLIFYLNSAAAVAAIILNEKKEILFTIRSREPFIGMLDLPGGFVDQGESAEDALKRELKEELNVDIEIKDFFMSLPNTYNYAGITYFTTDLFFFCEIVDSKSLKANDDVSAFEYIKPKEEIIEKIGLPSMKNVISKLINKK